MARRGGTKKQRFVRGVGIWSAVLMMLSSIGLVVVLVMYLVIGPEYMTIDSPRVYWIQFESESTILVDVKYRRGEAIDKPKDPKHSEEEYYSYTFRGWDINGDRTPDAIPSHAFYSFLAVAVYQKKQIKPLPQSSSTPNSSSQSSSGASSEASSGGNL